MLREIGRGFVRRAVVHDDDHDRQRVARAEAVETLNGQREPAVNWNHDASRRRLQEPHVWEPLTLNLNAAINAASAVIHPCPTRPAAPKTV